MTKEEKVYGYIIQDSAATCTAYNYDKH